ncbi:MAG TPA: inositol monophosphatase family protein [Ktedonobacterales bacterium]
MSTSADDPRPAFEAMFTAVRAYLLAEGGAIEARAPVATNPKGEATRGFDAESERIALDVARERLGAYCAFSEEAGELVCGRDARWTLVIDPCDGSNNFRRGIRAVGFAVAALPAGAPLDPELVEYALCGDIFTGTVYSAARGQGATIDGLPCHGSRLGMLRHAMLGVNLGRERNGRALPQETGDDDDDEPVHYTSSQVHRLLDRAATIRRMGATVLDLCYVAQGAYDAYVDLRDRLTPENFLAPALVLREAGALLTGPDGGSLGPVVFTQPYSVIASGTQALLGEILGVLRGE